MAARETGRSLGLLVARIMIAVLFLHAAYEHVFHLSKMADQIAQAHYPSPKGMALGAVILLGLGGLSVLTGTMTPLGCLALILFLVPTTYSIHWVVQHHNTVMVEKNLAILGGLIALLFAGPGGISVDSMVLRGGKR